MNKIKFGEIRINDVSRKHVLDCLDSHQVTMGSKVEELENQWSKLFGHKHTVGVSSGTSAVMAMCMSLYDFGAKPNDEIIVPALSFIASANAIRASGFTPVFVDVKKETLNINENLIEEKITPKTRAILGVNLIGKPCNVTKIREICNKHNLFFFLDCCESHGCKVNNKYMEEYADATSYSWFAAHISFSVEFGTVCTNNKELDYIIRSVRSHGRSPDSAYFNHYRFGLNMKPTDLHASIGLGSISEFWDIFNKRYENANKFKQGLSKLREFCWFSEEDEEHVNSPHAFSIVLKEKNEQKFNDLKKCFDNHNIEWKRNFGAMPTQHKCFEYLGHKLGEFPDAEHSGDFGLHFGVHQYLTDNEINYVIETLNDFFN